MAPSSKIVAAGKDRRKSSSAGNDTGSASPNRSANKLVVTLKVAPRKLQAIVDQTAIIKEETPVKENKDNKDDDIKDKESPATSNTLPAAPNSTAENVSDSTPNTPATGTPAPQAGSMGPPTEGPKKKGTKRAAGQMNGDPKPRGKPGPKKKQKLDDGNGEGGGQRSGPSGHKLGPRANQGAINAGLRALDRSGKPCRKWNKGAFTLKSFTGTVWEIPRWKAPHKPKPETATTSTEESVSASAEGSGKENKEAASQVKTDNSNNGVDVEMQSVPSVPAANSPAPPTVAVAAA